MFASLIIVFREVLEIALLITVLLAATKGVAQRSRWVVGGTTLGVIGAILVAMFARVITNFADGVGQELFNGAILMLAVAMLTWHLVWMSSHGREIAKKMSTIGQNVKIGTRPLSILAIISGVAVLREGSEIVLFLHGVAADGSTAAQLATGALLGLVAGAGLGAALYYGLLQIPLRRLFSVTNVLILFIAAGMASKAAGFFIQADVIPSLGYAVWDSSRILSENSMMGRFLSTLVGYTDRPTGMQVVFYLSTLTLLWFAITTNTKQSVKVISTT